MPCLLAAAAVGVLMNSIFRRVNVARRNRHQIRARQTGMYELESIVWYVAITISYYMLIFIFHHSFLRSSSALCLYFACHARHHFSSHPTSFLYFYACSRPLFAQRPQHAEHAAQVQRAAAAAR
jgi:hypothetical protein